MRKFATLLFLALATTIVSHADEVEDQMLKAAQQCSDAGISKDWEALANFMPPSIVDSMGGSEQLIAASKATDQKMTADRFILRKATVSKPLQKKEINQTIYTIIPQQLMIEVPQGTLRHKGYMLGISKQPYRVWHFMSVTRSNETDLKGMFPDIANGFVFPTHEKPVLDPK